MTEVPSLDSFRRVVVKVGSSSISGPNADQIGPLVDALAATYSTLAEPKAVVTPRIQTRADEITQGVTDRREQARLIGVRRISRNIYFFAVNRNDFAEYFHLCRAVQNLAPERSLCLITDEDNFALWVGKIARFVV